MPPKGQKHYWRESQTQKKKNKTAKKRPGTQSGILSTEFKRVRMGFLLGIGAITVSSAFMNISGWVSMSATFNQAAANAALSGGMEIIAICALPFAGFMMKHKHYGKAALALAIVGAALSFNIYATQTFLHVQADQLVNVIELSGAELAQINGDIAEIDREIESIIAGNDGLIPRDAETIERAYDNLDAENNPINMMNKDAELGARERYEELLAEKRALNEQAINPSIAANDTARSVIPPQHMRIFVTVLELMKATGLYILGNATLFWSSKQRANYQRRKKWAIINQRRIG